MFINDKIDRMDNQNRFKVFGEIVGVNGEFYNDCELNYYIKNKVKNGKDKIIKDNKIEKKIFNEFENFKEYVLKYYKIIFNNIFYIESDLEEFEYKLEERIFLKEELKNIFDDLIKMSENEINNFIFIKENKKIVNGKKVKYEIIYTYEEYFEKIEKKIKLNDKRIEEFKKYILNSAKLLEKFKFIIDVDNLENELLEFYNRVKMGENVKINISLGMNYNNGKKYIKEYIDYKNSVELYGFELININDSYNDYLNRYNYKKVN